MSEQKTENKEISAELFIKVKAYREVPNDTKYYLTINVLSHGEAYEYKRYDKKADMWVDRDGIYIDNNRIIWYKPISEDDLFPTTEELNKPNDSVEWMCGAVWAINYIKSKLTEK